MNPHRLRSISWPVAIALLASLLLASFLDSGITQADGGALYSPLERFGFNVAIGKGYGDITDFDVARLHACWYNNWYWRTTPPRPFGVEFVQTVLVGSGAWPPNWAELRHAVDNNRSSTWLIGNEPDQAFQDGIFPDEYARRYHQVYTLIKDRDPTAKLSAPGIVQPTPLRLQWLDMVLTAYQSTYGVEMPVDVWNIHNQILREDPNPAAGGCGIPPGVDAPHGELYSIYDNADPAIFRQHVLAFRRWMRDRGQRDKPLIISEYGVIMPSSYLGGGDPAYGDEVVKEYMRQTFDYLLSATDEELGYPADGNRLVQRWAWFSLNDKFWDTETYVGSNGALYDWRYPRYPGIITQFGLAYEAYTARFLDLKLYLPALLRLSWRPANMRGW